MITELPTARSWWRSGVTFDALLAGAFGAIGIGEVVLSDGFADASGWLVVLILLQTAPLAVRRRYPLMVHSVVTGAFLIQVSVFAPGVITPVTLVSLYTVGAERSWGGSITGLAISVLAIFYSISLAPEWTVWNLATALVEWSVVWALGVSARLARNNAIEQQRRLARLEQERTDLERQTIAHERARMARELHDAVGHSVSGMVLMAGAAGEMDRDNQKLLGALSAIEQSGRTAMNELDRLVGMLRDSDDNESELLPQPELHHLDNLVKDVERLGLEVELIVDRNGSPPPLSIGRATYRIVQESLSNALKYAEPKRAIVHINLLRDQVAISVSSPIGRTLGPRPRTGGGQGLIGMRERARILGGKFDARPQEGEFLVTVSLPHHSL